MSRFINQCLTLLWFQRPPKLLKNFRISAFNNSCFVSWTVIENREYFSRSLMMGPALSLDRGMPLCEIKYIDGQSRGVARYIIKLTHPSSASTNSLHPRAVVNVPTCTRHLNDLPTTLAPTSQTFANPAKSKRPSAFADRVKQQDFAIGRFTKFDQYANKRV